jgi:ATP-dependent Lon protease
MVFTRSQKRNFRLVDENGQETQEPEQDHTEKNEQDSGVKCIIKRRKVVEEVQDGETEELTFVSETETETEVTDVETSEAEDQEETEPDTTKLQSLIEESIKHLIAKKMKEQEQGVKTDEYDTFLSYVNGIHSGNFFERVPIEEQKKQFKSSFAKSDVKRFNEELEMIRNMYQGNAPSITDILKMDIHVSQKQKLLEKVYALANSDVLSSEYNASLKYLLSNLTKTEDPQLFELEKKIIETAQSDEHADDYRKKILKSKMSFENKVIAYKRLEVMDRYEDSDSTEYSKYKNWMDTLLSVPFGTYKENPCLETESEESIKSYIKNVRTVLDKRLSFLEKPKDQIINIVTQMVRNPGFSMNAIGLHGVKGLGKSSIVKSIAEALGRPYRVISLGGESDSSQLTGHGFTYVGSTPGRLIDILIESKCMNPVVLIDELDKVSQTHHGKEIIGTLIHLTDTTTNNKYNYDRYFSGVEFDLSKVLFVFTYNDPSKVDKILADRLFQIKLDNYSVKEKLEITNKHLIPTILEQYNLSSEQISFTDEAVKYIVNESRNDDGMREIKRKFEVIVSRINTLILTDEREDIIKLKYKTLYAHYKQFPVTVQQEHINVLLADSNTNDAQVKPPPMGMYI